MKTKKRANKYLVVLAAVLWVVSFGLAFVIAPGDRYIWVPDALLLIGFWPLLIAHRSRWLWIVFGLLNMFIGFFLIVVSFMPNSEFSFDAKVLATKTHLAQYHQPFAWMGIGFVSAVVGVVLVVTSLVVWIIGKIRKRAASGE